MINTQKDAFLESEANDYFARNQAILKNYSTEKDSVLKTIQDYKCVPKRVLEIGCNAGYRLNGLKIIYPECEVYGIEPSGDAIDYGKNNYQDIFLIQGMADDLSIFEDGFFDLVIIGFVLYVVDRNLLLKTVSEIDRVLANKGVLLNIDFFAQTPSLNAYTHINSMEAYTYKQNYDEVFLASRLYQCIDKRSFSHLNKQFDITDDYYNKYSITTLKKDLSAGYIK
jgi:ubiquinone/menaquinone biosynthesis C-methylase UbiE